MDEPIEDDPEPPPPWTAYRQWLVPAALGLVLVLGVAVLLLRQPAPVCIAVATSLSGPSAASGAEGLAAAGLAIADANRAGGVDGRPVELIAFDDQSRPDVGRRNVKAIDDSGCLAVLGHDRSGISVAAGALYKRAHIPAVTGTAFADEITAGNPWYFRAQATASLQGRAVAEYLTVLNDAPSVALIASDESFGRAYAAGFAAAYPPGRITQRTFNPAPSLREEASARLAGELAAAGAPEMIVLASGSDTVPPLVMALRRRGIAAPVIATGGAGSAEFFEQFAAQPEERRQPGFFTVRLYATPPLIFDSAGAVAQAFAARYRAVTHREPSWVAAGSYDAAAVLVEALRRAGVRNRSSSLVDDRERVRIALASMRGPRSGVAGLTRTLYFDAQRNMPGPVRMGVFARGRFQTHPRQLVPVERPDAVDLPAEIAAGHIAALGQRYFWLQQVVYTGIDFNRLNRVDLKEGTFNVDLNLWMRFLGDEGAATRVEFPDLLDQRAFDPTAPVDATEIPVPTNVGRSVGSRPGEAYNYRLYRIAGAFKGSYDLHDYPFDRQELRIRFLNQTERREVVTYVIDSQELKLANSEQRLPEDLAPFRGLQQWRLQGVRYFVDSLARPSSLGKPSAVEAGPLQYTGFNVAIVLERKYGIFLVKTLIPLALLVTVVFATLFLPGNLFRERINIPVTSILTSAVLLLSVNNQIGDIGYTVAIEYIFYAFFALCLSAMLIGITHDALSETGQRGRAALLARAGQVFYVTMVALVVLVVWLRFAR